MTSQELGRKFNNEFGLRNWPEEYPVDSETYANCCQAVFDALVQELEDYIPVEKGQHLTLVRLSLGKKNGLMFHNVELILQK